MRHQCARALIPGAWEPAADWGPSQPPTPWSPSKRPLKHQQLIGGPTSLVQHCLCMFSIFHALSTEELRRVSKRHLLEYRADIKKTPHPRKSDAGYSTLGNKKADHRVSTGGQPLSPPHVHRRAGSASCELPSARARGYPP